jgi:hypothetical protein
VTYLTMWQIMEPSFNQPGRMGELTRRTVTGPDNRPITSLESFGWLSEFRISLGMVAFTPQTITQSQDQLRTRMLQMFRTSSLGSQIMQRLVIPTVTPDPRDRLSHEHDAYIEEPGNLVGVTTGDPRRIADHPPPARSTTGPPQPPIVGYVHTHPPSPQILPPTPGSDWLDSAAYPVQLMVESAPRRVWGLIHPNLAFPLGLMTASGVLNELNPHSRQARNIYALRSA